MMNNRWIAITILALFPLLLSGCELIGSIFQAGVWVGILLVVVVAVGLFLLVKPGNRR